MAAEPLRYPALHEMSAYALLNFAATTPGRYVDVEMDGGLYRVRVDRRQHDHRCDRDLCHPDCPIRKQADEADLPYRGRTR